jgi:acetolactate synthase-1/3 small subunit
MMATIKTAELPRHTLSIHVANKPGVLMRVSQAFARRGFNIDSLVVSSSQDPRFSRMTVVCRGDAESLEQIIKQVAKIVDVIAARDHSGEDVIVREYALIKVNAPVEKRTEILQIVDHFKGQTLDFSNDSLVIQIAGTTEKLDAAIEHLDKYGVIEQVRSGQIVMARGRRET